MDTKSQSGKDTDHVIQSREVIHKVEEPGKSSSSVHKILSLKRNDSIPKEGSSHQVLNSTVGFKAS